LTHVVDDGLRVGVYVNSYANINIVVGHGVTPSIVHKRVGDFRFSLQRAAVHVAIDVPFVHFDFHQSHAFSVREQRFAERPRGNVRVSFRPMIGELAN
jgi:hypothetical protein